MRKGLYRPFSEQRNDKYESEAVRDRLTVLSMESAVNKCNDESEEEEKHRPVKTGEKTCSQTESRPISLKLLDHLNHFSQLIMVSGVLFFKFGVNRKLR